MRCLIASSAGLCRGNSAPARSGAAALLCCSGLFTYHDGVRAQEEILTLRLRQRMLQTCKDLATCGVQLWAAALPTSANVNPKGRTKSFSWLNHTLRLKSRWRSALRHPNRHHRNAKHSFSRLCLENYWRARCYPSAMYIVFSILASITQSGSTHKDTLSEWTPHYFSIFWTFFKMLPPFPSWPWNRCTSSQCFAVLGHPPTLDTPEWKVK